ncbi:MAG: glutathione S-transferase N-terminal domain-containing protein, partial [Pseudomonadota bacterium]
MEFYGYFRSSCAYRCRIALNLKGVPHSFHSVHLRRNGGEHRSEAYLQVNPQGLVPALREGALLLNQSLAIIEWLDETQP